MTEYIFLKTFLTCMALSLSLSLSLSIHTYDWYSLWFFNRHIHEPLILMVFFLFTLLKHVALLFSLVLRYLYPFIDYNMIPWTYHSPKLLMILFSCICKAAFYNSLFDLFELTNVWPRFPFYTLKTLGKQNSE